MAFPRILELSEADSLVVFALFGRRDAQGRISFAGLSPEWVERYEHVLGELEYREWVVCVNRSTQAGRPSVWRVLPRLFEEVMSGFLVRDRYVLVQRVIEEFRTSLEGMKGYPAVGTAALLGLKVTFFLLSEADQTLSQRDIARLFGYSQPTVCQHIAKLRDDLREVPSLLRRVNLLRAQLGIRPGLSLP